MTFSKVTQKQLFWPWQQIEQRLLCGPEQSSSYQWSEKKPLFHSVKMNQNKYLTYNDSSKIFLLKYKKHILTLKVYFMFLFIYYLSQPP